MALKGKKVLLIDSDPQGNLTDALGYLPDQLAVTLATVIARVVEDDAAFMPYEGILHHEEGLDLLPANIELSGTEMSLVTVMSRELILREYLEHIKDSYDFIFIDCSPSLSILTLNALAAADSVIIPVQTNYLPAKGLQLLLNTIANIRKRINPGLTIDGILMTLVDRRTNDSKEIIKVIRNTYGEHISIFDSMVPLCVKAAEAPEHGISIFQYDRTSTAAEAYMMFVQELLGEVDV